MTFHPVSSPQEIPRCLAGDQDCSIDSRNSGAIRPQDVPPLLASRPKVRRSNPFARPSRRPTSTQGNYLIILGLTDGVQPRLSQTSGPSPVQISVSFSWLFSPFTRTCAKRVKPRKGIPPRRLRTPCLDRHPLRWKVGLHCSAESPNSGLLNRSRRSSALGCKFHPGAPRPRDRRKGNSAE